MLIKFVGDRETQTGKAEVTGENLIKLYNLPENTRGFEVFLEDGTLVGDYKEYTTVYQKGEGWYILSNDGTVHQEEKPIVSEEMILFQKKQMKIQESKEKLRVYLLENPLKSTCHGGKEGFYAVTEEKQSLMASQYMSFQLEKGATGTAKLTWNETGKACEEWTEDEFVLLLLQVKTYVYPLVAKQQIYEEQINACRTSEEVDRIKIQYGGE